MTGVSRQGRRAARPGERRGPPRAPRAGSREVRASRGVSPAALALASVVAFVALYVFATGTRAGRGVDEDILNNALEHTPIEILAWLLVQAVNPVTAPAAVIGILWFALVKRGRGIAAALAVALLAANTSAPLLKALLHESDPLGGETARDLGPGFFPSGHATAAMSIVLAIIVLVRPGPARARAALVGGLAAGGVAVGNVVALTHHASDVVAAFLLATAWLAATLAFLPPRRTEPAGVPRAALAVAALAAALGTVGAVVAAGLGRPAAPVAAAGGMCAIALVLAAAVAALEPRDTER